MTSVQKLCDDGSTAHRPGPAPVDLDQSGGHHVVIFQFPKDLLTRLHVVVGHVEDVTCRGRNAGDTQEIQILKTFVQCVSEQLG